MCSPPDCEVALLRAIALVVVKVPHSHANIGPTRIARNPFRLAVIATMNYDDFRNRYRLFGETFEAKLEELGSADRCDDRGNRLLTRSSH